MSRWYDDEAQKIGSLNLDPFWRTRRGKAILLCVFLASIGAGMAIGWTAKVLFGL